jgi:TRAP-type transport system periplasmic protein
MKTKAWVIFFASFLTMAITGSGPINHSVFAQSIELKLATWNPPGEGEQSEGITWYANELEKRTNGRVKIKIFWSQSLAKQMEMPRAVKSGLADMATIVGSYHPELFPYDFGSSQAALVLAGAELGDWRGPYRKLMSEFPEVPDSFKKQNQKLLAFWDYDRMSVISTKPIRNFAESKGIKIRNSGEYVPRMFKVAGFNSVSIPAAEAYDAASRGMVDAIHTTADNALKYKFYEICKHWTDIPIFGTILGFPLTINLDTYNKLPPDVQAEMVKIGDQLTDMMPEIQRKYRNVFLKTFKEVGGNSYTFSEADMKEWKARISKDNMEYYIQKMEGMNVPKVRQIVSRFADLMNYKWQ